MHVVAFDTETARFRAGVMAPELACVTWMYADENDPGIVHWTQAHQWFAARLGQDTFVGHNVAYDMAVIGAAFPDLVPAIFRAYEEDRVVDTMIRQQLIDIGLGCYRGYAGPDGKWKKLQYSLLDVTRRHTGRVLEKDEWRLQYGSLRHQPLAEWPEGARIYPLEDARATLDCWRAQESCSEFLKDQHRQVRAAWALHLSSCWGLRTHLFGVDTLRCQTEAALEEVQQQLVAAGLVRKDGSRDTKAAAKHMVMVCERDGLLLRRTDKNGVCLDSDACEATEDPLLLAYAEFTGLGKTLNADIPMLERGTQQPIHCRYSIAESGRTTCSGPNIQNLRKLPGIREAFIPRPGKVFIQADFPQLELYTLAQCCMSWLGWSSLGNALKSGLDPHTAFAAELHGTSYKEGLALREAKHKAFDNARQIAKAFNFGKPGGLGAARLKELAAQAPYNVDITDDQARVYGAQWLKAWPEMPAYFQTINKLAANPDQEATIVIPGTDFVRGGARYCAACNTGFQGLGAACAKNAMWLVAKAQFTEPKSPLFGSRTVAFVHDEIIAECDEEVAHEAAHELARVMVLGANQFLPDVPIQQSKMEPLVMRMWSKDAKPVLRDGRLVPWTGKEAA